MEGINNTFGSLRYHAAWPHYMRYPTQSYNPDTEPTKLLLYPTNDKVTLKVWTSTDFLLPFSSVWFDLVKDRTHDLPHGKQTILSPGPIVTR